MNTLNIVLGVILALIANVAIAMDINNRQFDFDKDKYLFDWKESEIYLQKPFQEINNKLLKVNSVELFGEDHELLLLKRVIAHLFDCRGNHMVLGITSTPIDGPIQVEFVADGNMRVIPDDSAIQGIADRACKLWTPSNAI